MARILLVEDNEMSRDALSRRLTRRGYEVVLAVDGTEVLERARLEAPDLILMDMSLPTVSGWEASRLVKADAALRAIPIVALTAHATAEDLQRALEAGCEDFDTKPIDFARLLGKIQALLPEVMAGGEKVEKAGTPTRSSKPGCGAPEVLPRDLVGVPAFSSRLQELPDAAPTILVIDDDPEVQALMQRILNKQGFHVRGASGAEEGLASAREAIPDVIILDLMLTDRDGWGVLADLKASAELRHVPVILMSVLGEPPDVAERGAAAYLVKPVDRGALSAALDRYRVTAGGS